MSKVYCDIDSTLSDFDILARSVLANWNGTEEENKLAKVAAYTVWNHWRTFSDMVPFYDQVIKECHSDENIAKSVSFPDSAEILNRIAQKHKVIYISNRSPKSHAATLEWLMVNAYPIEDRKSLICTEESKIPLTMDGDYIIDDRPKTLVEFIYKGDKPRKAFGLMSAANHNLTDIPNIWLAPTWDLLEKYIERETDLL